MTVTVAESVPALPAASVALNVTVVSPSGKTARPSLVTARAPSTLSVAVAPAKKAAISAVDDCALESLNCQIASPL